MTFTRTAYVILGILAWEDNQSGYDIRKTVESSVGYFWGESYGQIYPTLKRLVAGGLIVARSSASAAKRRQEYTITQAGRESLEKWLALPYRDDPPRDEFLLKLFFGREAAPFVSIEHVRTFQEKNRRTLASILELETMARARNSHMPGFPFWMLTLSYGVAQLRSALEWSETALTVLSALESTEASKLKE